MPDIIGFLQIVSALAMLASECVSVFCKREREREPAPVPEPEPEPEPERKGAISIPASLGCVWTC